MAAGSMPTREGEGDYQDFEQGNVFVAGVEASVTVWSSAALAVASRPYVDPNPKFFDAHPVWRTIIAFYIGLARLSVFPTVRRPFIGWYRSPTWLVRGTDPIEIMFKRIGMRANDEFFAYLVSCLVGALGGWIYVVLRGRTGAMAEVRTAD